MQLLQKFAHCDVTREPLSLFWAVEYSYTHTITQTHSHTHTHIHIQTHTHTHTQTHAHTHTRTYTSSALALQRLKRRRAPKVVLPPPTGNVQTKVMSATLCTFRALRACCKNETRIIRVIHQTLENCNMSLALLGFFCYLFIVILKGRFWKEELTLCTFLQ